MLLLWAPAAAATEMVRSTATFEFTRAPNTLRSDQECDPGLIWGRLNPVDRNFLVATPFFSLSYRFAAEPAPNPHTILHHTHSPLVARLVPCVSIFSTIVIYTCSTYHSLPPNEHTQCVNKHNVTVVYRKCKPEDI